MSNALLLQKWETEYKKGFSKPLILFTLAEIEKSYAFLLTKKIQEMTKGQISITGSNIYPILSSLENDDLILSQPDETNRKYYELTEKGKQFLRQLENSIKDFNETILKIVDQNMFKGGSE
jgi:PadR family transcriptional regulator PadR